LQGVIASGNHHFRRFGWTEMVAPNLKEGTLVRFLVKLSAQNTATNPSALVPPVPLGPKLSAKRWRAPRNAVVAVAALFVLTVCAKPPPTPDTCLVPHQSGFIGAGSGQQRMTMMQNGKPCEMFIMNNGGGIGGGKIATPATHGAASLRFTYEATVISYVPAHDYVGRDQFAVAFGPGVIETVEVDVVPKP
jgi:hypothetical protein